MKTLILDNSALKELVCERKFQLKIIEGLKEPSKPALDFGNAVHHAFEAIDLGSDYITASRIAMEKNPTVDNTKLLKVLLEYQCKNNPPPIQLADKPAIEVKFSYKYGEFITEDAETVEVILVGTIDKIYIDPKTDTLVIRDYKTAWDFPPTAEAKMASYDLAFQLPFYVFALAKSGILPAQYKSYIIEQRYRTELLFVFMNQTPVSITPRVRGAFTESFLYSEVPQIINAKIAKAIRILSLSNKNLKAIHDGMSVEAGCNYCPFKQGCLVVGTQSEHEFLNAFPRVPYDPLSFR